MSHVYETQPGRFVVADGAGWIPGVYTTRAAAERAGRRGKGKLPRTPENFPRMKVRGRRRKDPIASWGGGMYCPCGARFTWGKVTRAEYDEICRDIDDHAAYCDGIPPF
jgi:hypothetical protein